MPFFINNIACVDPDSLGRESRIDPSEYKDCNSHVSPLGYDFGVAKVLMRIEDYKLLPTTATCTLTVVDGNGTRVDIPKLQVVPIRAALQTDQTYRNNAIVVVTLYDLRWSYRQVVAGKSYNYRDSTGTLISSTENSGTPWTWQGIINDLWSTLTTALGSSATAPIFPTSPSGTPEGLDFTAADVWCAVNRVCQAAGFALRFNAMTSAAEIVDPDGNTPQIPSYPQALRTYDNGVWTSQTAWATTARVPKKVKVAFPQPGVAAAYTIDESTAYGVTDVTTKSVAWDDMPIYSGVSANLTAAGYRAASVAKLWELDYISRANPNRIEFVGYQDWVRQALGYEGWSAWAIYDRGRGGGSAPGGVLSCVSNDRPTQTIYMPDPSKYTFSSGGSLKTQNTDATQVITSTTEIDADKTSGVGFTASGTKNTLAGIPAAQTQQGVVTTGNQVVAGRKVAVSAVSPLVTSPAPIPNSAAVGGGWDSYAIASRGDAQLVFGWGASCNDNPLTYPTLVTGTAYSIIPFTDTSKHFPLPPLYVGANTWPNAVNVSARIDVVNSGGFENSYASQFLTAANTRANAFFPTWSTGSTFAVGNPAPSSYDFTSNVPIVDFGCFGVFRNAGATGGNITISSNWVNPGLDSKPFPPSWAGCHLFQGIDWDFSQGANFYGLTNAPLGYPLVVGGVVVGVVTPATTAPPPPTSPPVSPPMSSPPLVPPPSPPASPPPPATVVVPPVTTSPPIVYPPPTYVAPPPSGASPPPPVTILPDPGTGVITSPTFPIRAPSSKKLLADNVVSGTIQSQRLIMTSPNGTPYQVAISDGGAFVITST